MGFLDSPALFWPLTIGPWIGVAWMLLPWGGPRYRRSAVVLAGIAAIGLLIGFPENMEAATSVPYSIIGYFGGIPILLALGLAVLPPSKDRLALLALDGVAITLGAIVMCGLLLVLFIWASKPEELVEAQIALQPVPVACIVLGLVLAVSSYRAVKSVP